VGKIDNFYFSLTDKSIKLDDGRVIPLNDPLAFSIISDAWLRAGWDIKYVYGFSWLGRPIIQLPEDLIRIQEVIYEIKPDIIVETGVAHGGSLIYYASICKSMGRGRVIGVDIEIRPQNKNAIKNHELNEFITLIEGNSIDTETISKVKSQIRSDETVLVILDSNHSKNHVLAELHGYADIVSPNSYIIACDGIMHSVEGAMRTDEDWSWNNPISAIQEFLTANNKFKVTEPTWPFNEGAYNKRITYWPNAYLKRMRGV
jgi:cephalosporin hydroxylase